jgi:hypothetical protein
MIGAKAVVAVMLTGLGSIATGTAAYLEAQPRTSTHVEMGQRAELVQPAPFLRVERSPVLDAPTSNVVTLETVEVTAWVQRRTHAVAALVKSESVTAPCAEWQDLATGPAGRRVRLLCQH